MNPRRQVLVAALIIATALIVLALESGRALHMDDPFYVEWAKRISTRWSDPYPGEYNWTGTARPLVLTMFNPPLFGWVLALVGKWTDWSERLLHLAELAPACLFLLASWELARRWSTRPLVALAIVAGSPAFLLPSAMLMPDISMSAVWVTAVCLWCKPATRRSSGGAAAAALLAGLTKWYGLALLPLLLAWELLVERRVTRRCAWLLLPLAATLVVNLWVERIHGVYLSTVASSAAAEQGQRDCGVALRAWIGLAFLGGSGVLLLMPFLVRSQAAILVTAALLACAAVPFAHAHLEPWPSLARIPEMERWLISAELGAFGFAGFVLLALVVRRTLRGGPQTRFLALWVAGALLFATFLDWGIFVRSFLPVLPALAITLANALGGVGFTRRPLGKALLGAGLGCAGLLGVLVLRSDSEVAAEARSTAMALTKSRSGERVWFQGHWGFQHYAEAAGATPIDRAHPLVNPGEIILVPMLNTQVFGVSGERVRTLDQRVVPLRSLFVTVGPRSGAGFWADKLGPLPFAWNLGEVAETWVFAQH